LICCPLAYSIILTQLYPSYMAHILGFRVTGHLWSQNDVNTSWLRLKATSNCFPHPYYTYTKCLSTLICCPLAYRYISSLTQLYQSYLDQIWGFRVTCVESKWCQYVVVEAGSHLKLLPHPNSTCTQCLSTLIWCPLHTVAALNIYTHPQHMMVVKHLICVWQWSWSHLGWFYSLNKSTLRCYFPLGRYPAC
jgi:hypothetical protein